MLNQTLPSDDHGRSGSLTPEVIIICVILSFFCVFGTVGNAMAFFIYYRKREKGTSTIFILSLAVTDLLTCLVVMPFTVVSELTIFYHFYDIVCKLYLFVQTFNIPLSSFIMVAIGFDRYFCICHPFLHAVTVPRAKWCVGILTVIAAVIGIIPMLSVGVYETKVTQVNVTVTPSPPSDRPVTTLFTDGLFVQPLPVYDDDDLPMESVNYKTKSSHVLQSTTTYLPQDANYLQDADLTMVVNVTKLSHHGYCSPSILILSEEFIGKYQKIYASMYLVEFLVLALLYALIYRSILVRRAWKNKRKRASCYVSTNGPETVAEETQLTNINGAATETVLLKSNAGGRMSSAMRDRALYANIKTAAMLFVVTVVFVISFLPSWLIGLKLFPMNYIVFYMFYINNVVNPIIYAFMNRTFREDLVQLLRSCVRR